MRQPIILVIFYFLAILFTSCKKDKLTKATESGKNTLSCKINGSVFKTCEDRGDFSTDPPIYGGVTISALTIASVTGKCFTGDPKKSVSIELSYFHGVGEYLLSDNNNVGSYSEYHSLPPFDRTYDTYKTKLGKVVITKDDRNNYILSGTFEFTASKRDSTNEIITITDGRFDLSYK
jgi:hypothetical protein